MKICAIICEYNPFHNGHLYQIREAKRLSGADGILCLMSGSFLQRGESAIMDKYTRAKHAIFAGADIVIELPVPFATSNAELFAKGAIHILSSIPEVTTLCFGAERASKESFYTAARLLNAEPCNVSATIKELTASGVSYAKARASAWSGVLPEEILHAPNCILGVEYTRAILDEGANIDILPLQRIGGGYRDKELSAEYSSATAIRAAIESGEGYERAIPDFVARDIPKRLEKELDLLEKYAILRTPAQELAKTCDCTEGLENAFKRAAEVPTPLVETLTSARYTSARIRRIALQSSLSVDEPFIRECLRSPLYLRVLAAKKERSDLLAVCSRAAFPLIARAHDEDGLTGVAKTCYEKDIFADKARALLYPCQTDKKEIFI